MPRIPFFGRLHTREYFAVIFGCLFIGFETVVQLAVFFLPSLVIDWFRNQTIKLFDNYVVGRRHRVSLEDDAEDEVRLADEIRVALDFAELCGIHGYDYEEHVVKTKDGYLLGLHRIPCKQGEKRYHSSTRPGMKRHKPVVYLHHGLLMCSDVFLCTTSAERCLPLMLVEAGYDVWLGNNRGNKYSKKHTSIPSFTRAFWNFSIDEFAWYDIPDSIEYILEVTQEKSLSYVGFSQGTAQAFAALSICPKLNEQIDVFVALAPAMSPPGLASPIVDGLMKASPSLMYLFFGRKSILSSTTMWQNILYPPIFSSIIDCSLDFLFDWQGNRISPAQKVAAYAHLYSFASTKSVVHWFQIMRNSVFQMHDDDAHSASPSSQGARADSTRFYYHPAIFPTRNISAPIVLLYGTKDSLVDIKVMKSQLPPHTTARPLEGYEHVDILWGRDVDKDVIPLVKKALRVYARKPEQAQDEAEVEGDSINEKEPILDGDLAQSEVEVDSYDGMDEKEPLLNGH